jgi:hypothetical protein
VYEEQELVFAFLSTPVYTRPKRRVQVIEKNVRDDGISTSDHLVPKSLPFLVVYDAIMLSKIELAITSLVTEIIMGKTIF